MMSKFGDGDKPDGSGADDGFGTEPSAEGAVCVMAQLVYGCSFWLQRQQDEQPSEPPQQPPF